MLNEFPSNFQSTFLYNHITVATQNYSFELANSSFTPKKSE